MIEYFGVYNQPASSLMDWKTNGCNLAVCSPEGHDKAAWRASARAAGMVYYDTPSSNLAQDAADPSLIAWVLPDEPRSLRGTKVGIEPLPFRTLCATLRAASPTKRLFCNFAGPDITAAAPWYKGDKDIPYFGPDNGPDSLTDISSDWYTCNRGYPEDLVIFQLECIKKWTNNTRRYVATLECCDQRMAVSKDKTKVIPTRATILSQVKRVAEWGVSAVIWFPLCPPPQFMWDGRNVEQKAACLEASNLYMKKPAKPVLTNDQIEDRLTSLESRLAAYDRFVTELSHNLGGSNA